MLPWHTRLYVLKHPKAPNHIGNISHARLLYNSFHETPVYFTSAIKPRMICVLNGTVKITQEFGLWSKRNIHRLRASALREADTVRQFAEQYHEWYASATHSVLHGAYYVGNLYRIETFTSHSIHSSICRISGECCIPLYNKRLLNLFHEDPSSDETILKTLFSVNLLYSLSYVSVIS